MPKETKSRAQGKTARQSPQALANMRADRAARRATRPRRVQEPPPGLVAMFTLVGDPDQDGRSHRHEAAAMWPVAKQLVDDLRAGDSRSRALKVALETVFPDVDDLDPSYGLEAGFRAGVAAAWLLMRDVTGVAR